MNRRAHTGRKAVLLGGILAVMAGGRTLAGTSWIVDGSNPACNNAGPGTDTSPLCTIQTAATKALAGDTVTVRPGVYPEQVTPKVSGTPLEPILYVGSPGVVLLGSVNISDPVGWTTTDNVVWSRPLSTLTKQVMVDGVRLAAATSLATMTSSSFFHDPLTLTLYVNTDGSNPGAGHLVEASTKTYGFNIAGLSNIVIDGFTMKAQNSAGVRLFNASAVVVRNIDSSLAAGYGVKLEASTGPVTIEGCSVSFAASNGFLVLANTGSTLRKNTSHDNGFHGISLQGSSSNLVTGNTCYRNVKPIIRSAAGIDVNAASLNNVIQSNTTFDNQDSGIQVYNGSDGNLVTRNISYRNGDHGFDTNKSVGTRYVSNTAQGNYKDGFSIEGGSTSTFMANNISVENGLGTAEFDLYVDELSVSGFFGDYDIVCNDGLASPIKFGGIVYGTLSAFQAATMNEAHGVDTDPVFVDAASGDFRLSPASPVSFLAYCDDCGASDPLLNVVVGVIASPSPAFVNQPVTVTGVAQNIDPSSIATYSFTFGDGASTGPQASAFTSHPFATRGLFALTTTICDLSGRCASASTLVTVTDIPPVAALVVTPGSVLTGVTVSADASTSNDGGGTAISGYSFNFGDGTLSIAQLSPLANHVYTRAGTFTVTVTVTNVSGMTASTTQSVIVTADLAPVVVLNLPKTARVRQVVTADATGSLDRETGIASYRFDFGDGFVTGAQSSPIATHAYSAQRTYNVTVTVTDTTGHSAQLTKKVQIKK